MKLQLVFSQTYAVMINLGPKSIKLMKELCVGEQLLLANASSKLWRMRSVKPTANDFPSIKTYFNSNGVLNQTVEEICINFINLKHFIFLLVLITIYATRI